MRRFPKAMLASIVDAAGEVTGPAKQLVEAIDFFLAEERREVRKHTMAKRYQVEKVERLLVSGGFPKAYAHRMALYMHHLDQPEAAPTVEMSAYAFRSATEQFDPNAICMLNLAVAEGQAAIVAGYVSRMMEQTQPFADKRSADVLKTMKKKDWKSAMARCEFALATSVSATRASSPAMVGRAHG